MDTSVSVVIPTLNEEKYLQRCLVSLQNQDYDPFEIIVVDGGSSDCTLKVAKEYAHKIVVATKQSPSVQRNLGAKVAQGEILAFIDADTVASAHWMKNIVTTLRDKTIVAVTGPLLPLENIKRWYLYNYVNKFQKFLTKIRYPCFWGASLAFRADAFWTIGGFDEKLSTSEDHDISLKIRKIGAVSFNENVLAFTSHRRFLKNERKAFTLYVNDVFDYFIIRKIKRIL